MAAERPSKRACRAPPAAEQHPCDLEEEEDLGDGGAAAAEEEGSDSSGSDGDDVAQHAVVSDELLAQDAGFVLRCWHGALPSDGDTVVQLRALCEEAFAAFDGRSFWVPVARYGAPAAADTGTGATADSANTWGALERFAEAVFAFHTAGLEDIEIDANKSGAEVWVQVRSSTEPAAQPGDSGDEEADEEQAPGEGASINWHFDKDEDLLDKCDVYIHPYISTVTYLSALGAPTVVFDARVTPDGALASFSGQDEGEGEEDEECHVNQAKVNAMVSFPVVGKHIAFNGRLLHGCPSSCATVAASNDGDGNRVSLLVNVWLNHKPVGVEELCSADPPVEAPSGCAVAVDEWLTPPLWAQQPALQKVCTTLAGYAKDRAFIPGPVEGGEDGFPVGAQGQWLKLRFPVDLLHIKLGGGRSGDCFELVVPVEVAQEEDADEDEEDGHDDEEEQDEDQDGD
jgi:hypothetical protein